MYAVIATVAAPFGPFVCHYRCMRSHNDGSWPFDTHSPLFCVITTMNAVLLNCCVHCHIGVGWSIHYTALLHAIITMYVVIDSQSFITQNWQTFSFSNERNSWTVFVFCDNKLNIFGVWTAGWPKQNMWRCKFGLLETVNVENCVFHYFIMFNNYTMNP